MPESRPRKRTTYQASTQTPTKKVTPGWLVPTMIAFLVIGLLWIVITYVFQGAYPIPGIGNGNLAIGFGFIIVGLGLTTRWY